MKKFILPIVISCLITTNIYSQNYLGKWILVSASNNTYPVDDATGYLNFESSIQYKAEFSDGTNSGYASAYYTMVNSTFITTIDGKNLILNGIQTISGSNGYTTSISSSSSAFNNYIGTAIGYGQPIINVDGVYLSLKSKDEKAIFSYIKEEYSVKADLSADITLGIAPLTVKFTDKSKGTVATREWNFGDGETSTEINPIHNYQNPGNYIVTLKVTNSYMSNTLIKKSDLTGWYIRVLDRKDLSALSSYEISGEDPFIVQFTDLSKGPLSSSPIISDWLWTFGDGETSTLQNPVHDYKVPGNYNVKLLIKNDTYRDSVIKNLTLGIEKFYIGSYSGSSPAIGLDGTIFIGSNSDNIYAFQPNGTQKWSFKTGGDVGSSPAIASDGTLYVGCSDGYFYAINSDGTLKWNYKTYITSCSPALGIDGTIYIAALGLFAFNPDGSLSWKFESVSGNKSSPAIGSDGTVYCGGGTNMYAINQDGSLKWNYKTGSTIQSSPAIDSDGTIYFGSNDNYLYALNKDGTLKWRYMTGNYVKSSPAIGKDGTIYVGSNDYYLYAINSNGTLKWKYQVNYFTFESSPAIGDDDIIYIGCSDDNLYAFYPDGLLKWKFKTGNDVLSSPVIGKNGKVYVGSGDSYLYSFISKSGGLAKSTWPCFRGAENHSANLNYGDPNAPVAFFSAATTKGFLPFEIHFKDSSMGNITNRTWDFGDGNTSLEQNPIHTFNSEGKYTIKLKVSNSSQSDIEIKTEFITVLNPNKVYADFRIDNDSGPGPLKIQFTDFSIGSADSWYWDFGDGHTSSLQNPSHTFYNPGNNLILFVISNSFGKDTLQKSVFVDATWRKFNLLWSYANSGNSSPAISNDEIIYVGRSNSIFYSINPNGSLNWEYNTKGSGLESSPTISSDGTIFINCRDGNLYAFNRSGTLKWKYWTGGGISSPALGDDGTIYVGSDNDYLYAINPDCTLKWRFLTGRDIKSSPAIGRDGTVYIGSWDEYLYAINPDGAMKWKYNIGYLINSSPAIGSDGTIFIGCDYRYLFAINSDGTLKWKFSTSGNVSSSPAIGGTDGTIYFGCLENNFYAVNMDGTKKWSFKTKGSIYSSPAISLDGTVYVGSYNGSIYAFNPDGKVKWEYIADGNISTSPTISINGMLYIVCNNDDIYAFSTDNGGLAESIWPCFRRNALHTGNVGEYTDSPNIELANYGFNCYPNPFSKNINIHFEITNTGFNQLEIYNLQGEKVNTLISKQLPIGKHEVTWDGTNQSGNKLTPGLYLINLISKNNLQSKKVLLQH